MKENQTNSRNVERVAVIGAGTMGHGIAQVAAMADYAVKLFDISSDVLATAAQRIRANLEKGVSIGKVDAAVRERALAKLSTTNRLVEAVESADLVVEAAPEDMALKRKIFSDVDAAAPPHAILASNTSSLSIAKIAEGTSDPGRVLGMHFFNPVHIMKLLEIVRTERTDESTIAAARAAGVAMGKTPIVVKDSPGFATSRLGLTLGLEATRMLEEGVASIEDIDTAMELGYGHPMGPFRLADLVGLDVRLAIAEYLYRETGSDRFRPPETLQRLVGEGKLGKKTGEGFYKWTDD
ncbi:MAG: 3-hydroxyacyl-CoA dehydrogenase family protein [Gemmatimonadota bacterium]|nr:MAG: 3-hydroxyacyl-CoA dehydrogenase family protein [Gemmatimonadota bacterium]